MTTRQIAHGIAQLGRHGDSTLVHMQPHEVAGLQALAKANGTSMTINPHTGLPEAFSLGGFFSSLLPTIAGWGASAAFPEYALMAGIGAGAATGALTNKRSPLMGAVMGGLGGYGGYGINNALQAAGSATTGAAAADASSGITTKLAQSGIDMSNPIVRDSVTQELMRSGVGADEIANIMKYGPMTGEQAATAVQTAANVGSHGALTAPAAKTFGESASNAWQGIKNLASGDDAAWQATREAIAGPGAVKPATNMQVATTFGMPLVGATLGGLEPSDIYGETVAPGANPKDKYDPYRTLNLNTDTGLHLYAAGGPVSFADGGDSNKELSLDPAGLPGGGVAALQGADQVEVTPGGTKLGIFATADQIDAARKADELAKAAQGRGLPGLGIMTGLDRGTVGLTNMGRMSGMGSTAPTMATLAARNVAPTAQTAAPKYNYLEQLNLNKQYATGGTIQSGGMQDLYNTNDDTTAGVALSRDGYGLGRLNAMAQGGVPGYKAGGYLDGPGDGMSDSIPATIEGRQPARLADGEFVIPADVVSHLGNGSTKAGSERLYGMLDKVRKARTGTTKQGKKINPAKYMPA